VGEPIYAKPHESIGHRIVRAMFVIIFFQLFWKFGGLIITLLVGSVFGSSPESDAYFFVTETVIFLLQTLCLKIFIPVVVPIFKEQLGTEGEEAAWRFGSTVLGLTAVVLALVTLGGIVFAPRITALIAEGFNERQAALTTRLMQWTFPGVFAICLATVTYALLNSYNVFSYAAAGDAIQKMLWAGMLLVASLLGLTLPRMLDAVAVAFLLASGATLLTHLLGLRSKLRFLRLGFPGLKLARIGIEAGILAGHAAALAGGLWVCRLLSPSLPSERAVLVLQQVVLILVVSAYLLLLWWRARGRKSPMAKFAALVVPLLFGILFAKYRDVLTNLFASFTGTGVFSDLKYARKIGEAPNTLVIAALSIAILPHLCELATERKWADFGEVMTRTIRSIVIFFVPLAALTVVLRRPVIQLLFDRGNWTNYHLSHAGDALGLYILSLPFFAVENPIQQSFFAMQRMWTPTLIGFLGTGFHILFLFVGIEWLGFGYFAVVALVYVAARAFKNIILLLVMRVHVKILPWRESIVFLSKALVVTLAVVLASHCTYAPLKRLLSLEPYRRREVMIDTFNVELADWEGDNVDELRIVSKGDPGLKEAFGDTAVVHGENALMARYRRSPRRSAGLRRDLSAFDLTSVGWIRMDVALGEAAELTLELMTRARRSFVHKPIRVARGASESIEVAIEAFGAGDEIGDVVGLWLRDTSRPPRVAAKMTTMVVDNLAFRLAPQKQIVRTLDGFEATTDTWSMPPRSVDEGDERPQIGDTGEGGGRAELALHLSADHPRRFLARDLGYHALAGYDRLTFKAKSQAAFELEVRLVPRGRSPSSAAYDAGMVAKVAVSASERRERYSVPIAEFKPQEGGKRHELGSIASIGFRVPSGVDFWLDNVAFVREPRGPRVGGISVMYEALKLIHVAVPSLAALVVFTVLLFVLRVEEARSSWEWLREKALKKMLAKLGRKT